LLPSQTEKACGMRRGMRILDAPPSPISYRCRCPGPICSHITRDTQSWCTARVEVDVTGRVEQQLHGVLAKSVSACRRGEGLQGPRNTCTTLHGHSPLRLTGSGCHAHPAHRAPYPPAYLGRRQQQRCHAVELSFPAVKLHEPLLEHRGLREGWSRTPAHNAKSNDGQRLWGPTVSAK
jgi:hypothetical protein